MKDNTNDKYVLKLIWRIIVVLVFMYFLYASISTFGGNDIGQDVVGLVFISLGLISFLIDLVRHLMKLKKRKTKDLEKSDERSKGQTKDKKLVLLIVISSVVVLLTAVGAVTYISVEKNKIRQQELEQQRELKEKELQTIKEAAELEAEAIKEAAKTQAEPGKQKAYNDCVANGGDVYFCSVNHLW